MDNTGLGQRATANDAPPELSSIASALDDITTRIGTLAETCSQEGRDELAHELFEVERALLGGNRRLQRVVSR